MKIVQKYGKRKIALAALIVFVVLIGVVTILSNRKPVAPVLSAPKVATVSVTEDGFAPETIKVKAGTEIIWTNVDNVPIRIAANPVGTHSDLRTLDSKSNISTNGTYRYTFNQAGTFHYHDELNPKINGTVVVE